MDTKTRLASYDDVESYVMKWVRWHGITDTHLIADLIQHAMLRTFQLAFIRPNELANILNGYYARWRRYKAKELSFQMFDI